MNSETKEIVRVEAFTDLVDRIAKFDRIMIRDRVYTSDYLIPFLTIDATRLLEEAATAPHQMLYWGLEAARARRYHAMVEAAYRQWRDRKYLEVKRAGDGARPPSDAHAEASYRADPEYGGWRKRLDDAQEGAEFAEAIHGAFRAKVDLIKTQAKLLSDEAGGAYVVQENPVKFVPREPQVA